MSYTAIPTSISRSTSPTSLSGSSRGSPSQSEIPLLPTSSNSPEYSHKELEDVDETEYAWSRGDGKEAGWKKKKRSLIIGLLVPLVVFTLFGFAYVANESERLPIHKVPAWIQGHFRGGKPEIQTLLVPRVETENGTQFSYYAEPMTNPVMPQWPLDVDHELTIELLPSTVPAATPSSLIFHCAHKNVTYCAQAYRVVFMGPTMHSPSWSDSTQLDERRVEVKFNIADPGEYQIYAWPEHDECNPFQPELHEWKIRPYFRLAVENTPALINIEGPPPVDATRECTLEDDLTDGRWISRKHINPEHFEEDSPVFDWLQSHLDPPATSLKTLTDYRNFHYIFANYKCKVQHRTFEGFVNEIKPERILFLGDSVTRDQMCLNYGVADQSRGACLYERWDAPYEKHDKDVPLVRTSDNGTTQITFHWEPLGDPVDAEKFLQKLPNPPPTHIFFEIGLWLTEKSTSPHDYVDSMRPFISTLERLAPNASLMTRTTASAVQPIACYDRKHIQRRVLEPVNQAFISFMREEFPRVTLLDSYKIYDHRPEASQDGRHWEKIELDPKWSKPEEGAVTYAMTDIIFETWRLQGLAGHRK